MKSQKLCGYELTVCDASQGLVEGGCVAVISECDTHSSREKPSGQSEGLLILQQPAPEALIVHLVTLTQHTITLLGWTISVIIPILVFCSVFLSRCSFIIRFICNSFSCFFETVLYEFLNLFLLHKTNHLKG